MEAYLDNSATTKCAALVCDLMKTMLCDTYGNPSSLHLMGMQAEKEIKTARERIAKTLKVSENEIYFTSGGTESNNLALIGVAMANKRRGMHLITTKIEHASVLSTMEFLKEQGFEITYLSVDKNGCIDLEELRESVRPDTILVSIMQVNNEIGTIEPIAEAATVIKEKNPDTLVHVDAIQSFGKLRITPKKMGIDLLSVSGHKIHGPKGSGFLYCKAKTKIKPILFGGGQQEGLRSGTENVPAIAGLGLAAELIYQDFDAKIEHMYKLRDEFAEGLQKIEGVSVNGAKDRACAPHIISVSVKDVRSEVLLHSLEEKGVYVSAGSACSSNKRAVSSTLSAIGLPKELLDSTVRFSLSVDTTKEELQYALQCMEEIVPFRRKFVRH